MRAPCFCMFLLVVLASMASGQGATGGAGRQAEVSRNHVFGMVSGLALLMDVYRPAATNRRGIVYVPGSGFHSPLGYGADPITKWTNPWVPALVDAGYTVFVINHRAAPRFRHPAALEDVERAIRYVRHHAAEWGIRPDRLGAGGYSSGGTLAVLAGVVDEHTDASAIDPVERESARPQCVMAGGAAYDFTTLQTPIALPIVGSYLGMTIALGYPREGPEYRLYHDASPAAHLSSGDADLFVIHGDADDLIPYAQVEALAAAAQSAGVRLTTVRIPGGTHGDLNPPGAPDYLGKMVAWFGDCLL